MPISSVSRRVTPVGACTMRKPPGIPNELFTYERKKRHWTQGDVADKISAPDERLIRRWEHGDVAPTPHYRGKLAAVFGKSARELGFPPDGQISCWHMRIAIVSTTIRFCGYTPPHIKTSLRVLLPLLTCLIFLGKTQQIQPSLSKRSRSG